MAQLLPACSVTVERTPTLQLKDVRVSIEGLAVAANNPPQDPGEERNALQHNMDIAVIREHSLESGAISRRVVPQVEPSRE